MADKQYHLYIATFGFDGENLNTSRLLSQYSPQEFYNLMADNIREQYGTKFVFVTEIRPLGTELNNEMCKYTNNIKLYG